MLNKNLAANYFNIAWVALMGFAFVPLYVKYLGVEAYGLIGLFAVLQAWLNLLDMGMSPTMNREMARFKGGGQDGKSILGLLRSVELIAACLMLLIALGVGFASGWLSEHWVQSNQLDAGVVSNALALMGVICAIGFGTGIYRSTLIGLQKQVVLSLLTSGVATLRGLGAVGVLAWISPTIEAFFIWQAACSIVMLVSLRIAAYGALPTPPGRLGLNWSALREIRAFAGGVFGTTLLATLLSQGDKFILASLLTLEEWGHYSLALVAARALSLLYQPLYQVWLPRMSELVAAGKEEELKRFFHLGCQCVTVVLGAATAVAVFNADALLYVWTGDKVLVSQFSPIFSLLVIGNLLNSLLVIPYGLQLAKGWTSLGLKGNAIAVALLMPALLLVVPKYGGAGAASMWIVLNLGYLLIGMHFMFGKILSKEKGEWYARDVLLPLLSCIVIAFVMRELAPAMESRSGAFAVLLAMGLGVLISAILSAHRVRGYALRLLRQRFVKRAV